MTTAVDPSPGVTFAVDDVAPAIERLAEERAHAALARTLGAPVEACSDYHGSVVWARPCHPLMTAVHRAYADHRPLVLSPDAVWLTIAHGVAQHLAKHAEDLRPRLVAHPGRLTLVHDVRGWIPNSPENPWAEAFAGWSAQIRAHVGPAVHGALACDFSTTGPVERAAGDIVTLDTFERYFDYVVRSICGIPAVTLTGTPGDWRRLADKAAALRVFEFDWWLEHLLPVCEQFARAAAGDVDSGHWQNICKLREEYGGDIVNGWVTTLFPYIRAERDETVTRRNPVLGTGQGFRTFQTPTGLSRVSFAWQLAPGQTRRMEAIGGLVGVRQHADSGALEPIAGWAVRAM